MASIRQYQRRAIEGLRDAARRLGAALPEPLTPLPPDVADREFYLDGTRLYPWGVSRGYGTCADVPGMDVLVLGREPAVRTTQDVQGARCAFAVLLEVEPPRDGVTRPVVQLLKPAAAGPPTQFVAPADPDCSATYVATIT